MHTQTRAATVAQVKRAQKAGLRGRNVCFGPTLSSSRLRLLALRTNVSHTAAQQQHSVFPLRANGASSHVKRKFLAFRALRVTFSRILEKK